jgi:hypothetical protein
MQRWLIGMFSARNGDKVASPELIEIFTGFIWSRGRKIPCMVAARRTTEHRSGKVTYSDYRIRDLAEAVEDGEYRVEVNGTRLTLVVQDRQLSTIQPPPDPESNVSLLRSDAPAFS